MVLSEEYFGVSKGNKSSEHKKKIGRKGLVMLKNVKFKKNETSPEGFNYGRTRGTKSNAN